MSDRDLARELDEASDAPTRTWRAAVGDSIIGRIETIDQVTSKYATGLQIRIVVDEDGTGDRVAIYCHHTVLRREIDAQHPRVGDRLAIKRLPDVPGKSYRRYRVLVDRASGADQGPDVPADGGDPDFRFGANLDKFRSSADVDDEVH